MKSKNTSQKGLGSQGRPPLKRKPMLLDETESWEVDPRSVNRYWSRVLKTEGCWMFQGKPKRKGHKVMALKTQRGWVITHANRVAWFLQNGPIPSGMIVCHNCPGGDNPACVNPEHLFLGTDGHNVLDMERKGRGRHPRGEQRSNCKLQEIIVRSILIDFLSNGFRQRDLVKKYGYSKPTIWQICHGRSWTHVSEDFGISKVNRYRSSVNNFISLPPVRKINQT